MADAAERTGGPAHGVGRRPRRPVVLVTGASQGLGEAIARAFAGAGIGGLALVARQEERLRAVAAACRRVAGAPAVEAFPCDVADEAAVGGLEQAVRRRFRRVDVLVNNAGRYLGAEFAETAVADFDAVLAANLRSAFLVTRAFLPGMLVRGAGDVFFMGSIASLEGLPRGAAYCAAKYGVLGLARVLREETRTRGVRVCCVMPGPAVSPSWQGSGVPADRMMPAEDVAAAFLAVWRMSRRTVVEDVVLRPQMGNL